VQALVFVIALMVCLVNLGVDLMYVWLNPRVGAS
jgi:ABC-type dipeptide/oligopeptide/nickel transport system permease component